MYALFEPNGESNSIDFGKDLF